MKDVSLENVISEIERAYNEKQMVSVIFQDKCESNSIEILSIIEGLFTEDGIFGFYVSAACVCLSRFKSVVFDEIDNYYILEDNCVKLCISFF